jgi:hypothetical protein
MLSIMLLNTILATPFEVARHVLGAVVAVQVNGFVLPQEDWPEDVTQDGLIKRITDGLLRHGLSETDIASKQDEIEELADQAAFNGVIVNCPEHGCNVLIPFQLNDLSHIVIGTCWDDDEDDGALLHPMNVLFCTHDGRRYDIDLEPQDGDHPLLEADAAVVVKTVKFPHFDRRQLVHRMIDVGGPSRHTYAICRLILGADAAALAAELKLHVSTVEALRIALGDLIDPTAVMPDYWPADFRPAVSCPETEGPYLCHRFPAASVIT